MPSLALACRLSAVSMALRRAFPGAFSPASLFANGEQGLWYDVSDFSTLFQDAAGTVPVTAVEQPVGRILDRSGRGNHASQANTLSRAWLRARYNRYLDSETLSTQNVTVSAGPHRLRFEGAGTITLSGAATGTFSAGTHTVICTAGTLTSTVSGVVTKADLRPADLPASLPPYQRIAAATDYDTVGFPVYLDPDGTDDGYQTGSIDFTATDKMTIWAGLRKTDDTVRMLCELSANVNNNNGAFAVVTGNDVNSFYQSSSRGNATSVATQAAKFATGLYPAPDSAVITATHDIAGDLSRIRRNGSSTGAIDGTGDKGTGNFGNYPLHLFSRGGTSLRFKGRFYALVIRGAATEQAQLEQTEQWLNAKMGGIY